VRLIIAVYHAAGQKEMQWWKSVKNARGKSSVNKIPIRKLPKVIKYRKKISTQQNNDKKMQINPNQKSEFLEKF
jgi:hypothetical protein